MYREEKVNLPSPSFSSAIDTRSLSGVVDIKKDKGYYLGIEEDFDDQTKPKDDGLGDIWKEMTMALECSKVSSFHE